MPLDIYLVTFNCGRELIDPVLLGTHLFNALPSGTRALPAIIALSLQEVAPIAYSFLGGASLHAYLDRAEQSVHYAARLRLNDGSDSASAVYERLVVENVGMTAAAVFVKKDIKHRIQSIETAGVGVGVWEMGDKGGVGIRLGLNDGTELSFIAMHLAAMEGDVLRRNKDWENICRGLVFEGSGKDGTTSSAEREPLLSNPNSNPGQTGLYKPESHIFLFGDLNYRTSHDPPGPSTYKTYPQPPNHQSSPGSRTERIAIPELLSRDQLSHERLANRTLHGFEEQPITFSPTYKYSHKRATIPGLEVLPEEASDGSSAITKEPSEWTWTHHRWPSWCDRVLFYPSASIKPGTYTSLPLLPSSDHRAVALHVTLIPNISSTQPADLRLAPPFPLHPMWKAKRAAARKAEIAVGSASWLILTTEGEALLALVLCGALAVLFWPSSG